MPLFKAKVAVMVEEEIPVYAESLEEARRYLETEDEWKQGDSSMTMLDVEQVSDPKGLSGWADYYCLCWGGDPADEISVVEAFYDYKTRDYIGLTENQIEDLWEYEASEVESLRAKFRQISGG